MPPVLRLLAIAFPEVFPYHPHWRVDSCHAAFWRDLASCDHVVPLARCGTSSPDNLLTACYLCNSMKQCWLVEELGWQVRPIPPDSDWDGLSGVYPRLLAACEETWPAARSEYFRAWLAAFGTGPTEVNVASRPMPGYALGVDGCKAGWIAAARATTSGRLAFTVHLTLSELLGAHPHAARIAIDIPIGLTESFQPRACDCIARRLVRPRSSSVFPAPDRRLLRFRAYAEAGAFSREHSGRGVTRQSFAIFARIDEADRLLSPQLQDRVFEIHPEVCFWAAAGQQPLRHPKRKPQGFEERRLILQQALSGVSIPTRVEAANLHPGVAPDDVLDAAIACWTASRHAAGCSARIPDSPPLDPRGLRMEMIY